MNLNTNKLRGLIASRGFGISDVADAIDMHRNTLYSRMSGRTEFTIRELREIAVFLKMTVEEILWVYFDIGGGEVAYM